MKIFKARAGFTLAAIVLMVSCREGGTNSLLSSSEPKNPLASIQYIDLLPTGQLEPDTDDGFFAQPGLCNEQYSGDYYCSGYSAKREPYRNSKQQPTPESFSSTVPESKFSGIQVIDYFDRNRPSLIYTHGWNSNHPQSVNSMPDYWIIQAQMAGYNTLYFHWSEYSYDVGEGCLGLGVFGGGIPCNAAYNIFKAGGITDIFLDSYRELFSGSTAPVRLVGHSLGSMLVTYATYLMHIDPRFNYIAKPNRIDLIEPFVMIGLGANRSNPYDGQIPQDDNLYPIYRKNIVKDFVKGSACRSKWNVILPPNHNSQYCQIEGMVYRLIKDYNVPTFVMTSIVGDLTARDLVKVAVTQSFGLAAFKFDVTSKHATPITSYMLSFAPGEPLGGFDASTSDEIILNLAIQQALDRENVGRVQTAGFNTINLLDDEFEMR